MNKSLIIKALIGMFAGIVLGLSLASFHIYRIWNTHYEGEAKLFKISQGESFGQINYRLAKENLIANARIYHYYNRYKKTLNSYKSGTYEIPSGATMADIFNIFISGIPMSILVTIPEGKNMYEVAKILEQQKLTTYDEFMNLARNTEFMSELEVPAGTVEGYLYPETYRFSPDVETKTIIKTFVHEFKKKTAQLQFENTLLSPHEVVILASIVEKETGARKERPIIAGVFHNRLKKKMRLQSDPTTIYGIYETFTGNIKKSDLMTKSPYNTYTVEALPAGPISNPGLDAMKAVLNPVVSDYLYFVSNNDGTHTFSATYEAHSSAVVELQKNRKSREGKSWRDLKQ
ncbi:MAG: endolytic transglycosylase MltG [Bacteriovoracaceae bacterium]